MKGRNGELHKILLQTFVIIILLKIFMICYFELIFIAYLFPQLLLKQSYLPVLGLH